MKVIKDWVSKPDMTQQNGNAGGLSDAEAAAARAKCGNMKDQGGGGGGSNDMKPRGVVDSVQERPSGY